VRRRGEDYTTRQPAIWLTDIPMGVSTVWRFASEPSARMPHTGRGAKLARHGDPDWEKQHRSKHDHGAAESLPIGQVVSGSIATRFERTCC
jgi:hypothetical protein